MAPTHTAALVREDVIRDPRWALIERIALSQHFRSSARLKDFLFYIADCAIREVPEEATEQQIGIHLFHRQPGYNSSEDSIVRTHARLLRQKLAAYFSEEGQDEPVILEVPKGHYLPVFRPREEHDPVLQVNPPQIVVTTKLPSTSPEVAADSAVPEPRSGWKLAIGLLILALAGSAAAWLALRWQHKNAEQTSVNRFWKPFFNGDPPLVVFSNALFVGDSKRGLSYATQTSSSEQPAAENLVDTYTGIGELASVYTLTRLFDEHHAHFILKRSLLMTWDEAKATNLIFIGSTAENPSLNALQSTQDFSMVALPDRSGFVNHHAKPGELAAYMRPEHPLTKDYAIIALVPGMQPGERILIFSGLTTYGTQAAVEFACHPDTAKELVRQISNAKGEIRPFEALIDTTITGGVPVRARLVTVHVH